MFITPEMSLVVSSLEGGQQELFNGSKHSLIMNGSPRTSSHQQRLHPIQTSNANGHAVNGAVVTSGPLVASPTQSGQNSPSSRLSYEASTYPPTRHSLSRPRAENNLQVPIPIANHNRPSSPAGLQRGSGYLSASAPTGSETSIKSQAPRLQHRHTLEVPRSSAGRTSKEFKSGDGASADDLQSTRFSPTSRARRGSLTLGRGTNRSTYSDLHLDEPPPDGDQTKWTEAIRHKRASRKRRKEEEDDDRVVVGTKVDQHHVNWVTAYNMLTGIRFTVSGTNAKLDRELTDADFAARNKFSFDITGNEMTPGAKYDFKFKDYAPWVFRHLRQIFSIDPADYLISLTSKYILSELGSPGKSGSFFYFSRDYKYIIKTIHHGEHVFLRKILKQYYTHVDKNRNTLLSQFYGLHRVKTPWSGKKIHFVVMNNLFPPHRDIHRTFDLKGSLMGRDYREEDLEKHPRATLKDLNWLRRHMHLELGPEKKNAFVQQMRRDVQLLEQLKIMDYSLLVGIHDLERGNEENLRDKTLRVFQPGGDEEAESSQALEAITRTASKLEHARKAKELRHMVINQRPIPLGSSSSKMPDELPDDVRDERRNRYFYSDDGGFRATHQDDQAGEAIYYLGIIDCLTRYNFTKKAEHFWKGMKNPKHEPDISAIPPDRYGRRFVDFISRNTMPRRPTGTTEAEKKSGSLDSGRAPDRTRLAVEAPGPDGVTLPVVEEAGETTSIGGKSGRSGQSEQASREREVKTEELIEKERTTRAAQPP